MIEGKGRRVSADTDEKSTLMHADATQISADNL